MLISFNTFSNCLSLLSLYLITSLYAIDSELIWMSFDNTTQECKDLFENLFMNSSLSSAKSQEQYFESCLIPGSQSQEGIKYGNYCYIFVDKIAMNWSRALDECRKINGSNLLSICSASEQHFIKSYTLLRFNSSDFWIGFYGKQNSTQIQFRWSDGSPVNLTSWGPHQPSVNFNLSDICVYQMQNSSEWTVDSCNQKRHFICKTKIMEKTPKNPQNYTKYVCPSNTNVNINWVNIDQSSEFCYWFSVDFDRDLLKTTWSEAYLKCRSHNSTLASIHSMESLMKFKNKILENTWIGLSRNEQGYYKWDDSTAVDFTNWKNSQKDINRNCVSVQQKDLKWSQNQCFDKTIVYNFICQKKKVFNSDKRRSTISTESTSMITKTPTPQIKRTTQTVSPTINTPSNVSHLIDTSQDSTTPSGLPRVAKLGFILLGVIIVISLVINVYFVSKRVQFNRYFKRDVKTKRAKKSTQDRRQRADDILNSSDPNIVFSNIRLK